MSQGNDSELVMQVLKAKHRNQFKFINTFKEKMSLIKLLCEKPHFVAQLSRKTKIPSRTIHRVIEHMKKQGFKFHNRHDCTYQIIEFPQDISELITDLFYLIHQVNRKN